VSALVLAVAAGCGGSSGSGARAGSDGGGGIGGAAGGGFDGAGCSALQNVGQVVTQEQASGDPPAPLGGAIAVGTYVLTRDQAYPPISASIPAHSRETLLISDTGVDIAVASDDFPDGYAARATLVATGTQATLTYVCGPAGGASFDQGYTATATELVFISNPGSVRTFTKQ
jgi:hypothetical protein